MLPVFRCVACAGCRARAALLVVTCDVTWAAEPLSVLLLPALLPACVCCARVTVVAVVIVTCLMLPVFRCVVVVVLFPIPKPYSLHTLRVFLSSCAGGVGGGGVPGLLFVIHISGGVKSPNF